MGAVRALSASGARPRSALCHTIAAALVGGQAGCGFGAGDPGPGRSSYAVLMRAAKPCRNAPGIGLVFNLPQASQEIDHAIEKFQSIAGRSKRKPDFRS